MDFRTFTSVVRVKVLTTVTFTQSGERHGRPRAAFAVKNPQNLEYYCYFCQIGAKVKRTDWECTYHIPGNTGAPVVRHKNDVLSPWQPPTAREPLQTSLPAYDEEKRKMILCLNQDTLGH